MEILVDNLIFLVKFIVGLAVFTVALCCLFGSIAFALGFAVNVYRDLTDR